MRHSFSLLFCAGAGVLLIVLAGLVVGFWDRQAPISFTDLSGDPSALSGFTIGGTVADGATWTDFTISGGKSRMGSKRYNSQLRNDSDFYDASFEPDASGVTWDPRLMLWDPGNGGPAYVMLKGNPQLASTTTAMVFPVEVQQPAVPWLHPHRYTAQAGDKVYCVVPANPQSTGTNAIYRLDDGGGNPANGSTIEHMYLRGSGELPTPCGKVTPIATFSLDNRDLQVVELFAVGKDRLILRLEEAGAPLLWLYDLDGNLLDQLSLPPAGAEQEIFCSTLEGGILVSYQTRDGRGADHRLVDVDDRLTLSPPVEEAMVAHGIHAAALLSGRLLLLTPAEEDVPVLDDEHPVGEITYSQVMVRIFREQDGAAKLVYEGLLACPMEDGLYRNFPRLWVRKEAVK